MEENFIGNLLKKPIWVAFLISWLFYLVGLFLFSQMVWDTNTYMIDFKGDNFDQFISNVRRIDMIRYALSPIWIMGISAVIFILVKTGIVIIRAEFDTALLFKIIFLGFLFLSLPFWVKSVGLILFKSGYTPDDVKAYFPGSIVPFISASGMSEVKMKALANINIYHLAFMLFISWQLTVNSSLNYFKSFLLVICTYGFGVAFLQYAKVLFF